MTSPYRCMPRQPSGSYETSLEVHCDHLAQQCADLRAALADLVDALFRVPGPSIWTEPQQEHVRLTLRAALNALDAADTSIPGELYA